MVKLVVKWKVEPDPKGEVVKVLNSLWREMGGDLVVHEVEDQPQTIFAMDEVAEDIFADIEFELPTMDWRTNRGRPRKYNFHEMAVGELRVFPVDFMREHDLQPDRMRVAICNVAKREAMKFTTRTNPDTQAFEIVRTQ